KAAKASLFRIAGALLRAFNDRCPGGDGHSGRSRLTPQLQQSRADQRILHAVAGIEIPGIAGAARTSAWLVVGQLRPGAGIICLLRLPGDDPALDVDLP